MNDLSHFRQSLEQLELPFQDVRKQSYVARVDGMRMLSIHTRDRTFIAVTTPTGIEKKTLITVPRHSSQEERDNIIVELYGQGLSFTQMQIADILDVSQTTVSRVLRERDVRTRR